MSDPKFEIMEVTPEMAADWLGRKRRNRNLRQRDIDKITRDIQAGRWHMNGDSIKFGLDGLLDDGQHRLSAIVAADTAVRTQVMNGLAPEARHTVDTGISRKYGDMLTIDGFADANLLASVVRRMWRWDRGEYITHGGGQVNPSTYELDSYLEKNRDVLENALAWARPVYQDARVTPTVLTTMVIILARARKGGDRSPEFLNGWVSGAMLDEGSPVLALRRRLARADDNKSDSINQESRRGLACLAWRSWVQGKKIESRGLVIPSGGFTSRNFPVPE
jgi:hypothetical protein